jgi:hypothetical protein
MDTEKIIRSIVKVADDRTKPVKKSFRFNLLKLICKEQGEEAQNKIKSAIGNQNGWDENCIQNLALNSLQDIFFNVIDILKTEKTGYNNQEYYIMDRHLEMILEGYLEKVRELEEEIYKLSEDSITYEEHNSIVKELNKKIKDKDNDIEKLEAKIKSKITFAKEKEQYDKAIEDKQDAYILKCENAMKEESIEY